MFTINNPYKVQVIQYLGDFETKNQYLAKHGDPVGGDTADGAVGGTPDIRCTDIDNPDEPPLDIPSEPKTEDVITAGRRVQMPWVRKEMTEQYARPRYTLSTKLQYVEANAIINAYASGHEKVLYSHCQFPLFYKFNF